MVEYPPPHFKCVEVIWEDSTSSPDGWQDDDSLPKPSIMFSRGWLVKEEKSYVCVACTAYKTYEGNWMFGEVISIPRRCILTPIREIGAKKPPVKKKARVVASRR